jgi:hypothetical protein
MSPQCGRSCAWSYWSKRGPSTVFPAEAATRPSAGLVRVVQVVLVFIEISKSLTHCLFLKRTHLHATTVANSQKSPAHLAHLDQANAHLIRSYYFYSRVMPVLGPITGRLAARMPTSPCSQLWVTDDFIRRCI